MDSTEPVFTLGERIRDTPRYSGWRTIYPVFRDGQLCAFLAMKSGWGMPWKLYKIVRAEKGATGINFRGYGPAYNSFCRTLRHRFAETMGFYTSAAFPTAVELEAQHNKMMNQLDKAKQDYVESLRNQLREQEGVLDGLDSLRGRNPLTAQEMFALNFVRDQTFASITRLEEKILKEGSL